MNEKRQARYNVAEWVISLIALGILIACFVGARGWPRNTAFFPLLLSGTGIALMLFKLVRMVGGWDRSGRIEVAPTGGVEDEDVANEDDIKSDFAAAPPAVWASVGGWLVGFFVALYLFGLMITLPVFTALYLRFAARMSYPGIILYVLATSGVIYALFVGFLHLPLPQGVLISIG